MDRARSIDKSGLCISCCLRCESHLMKLWKALRSAAVFSRLEVGVQVIAPARMSVSRSTYRSVERPAAGRLESPVARQRHALFARAHGPRAVRHVRDCRLGSPNRTTMRPRSFDRELVTSIEGEQCDHATWRG